MSHFPFTSYAWAVRTTSFRTVNFNVQIERQLALLDEFWALPENNGATWESNNTLQSSLYRFFQGNGLVDGKAPRPDKDARQITSGLVVIGLITHERRLSSAGETLLGISQSGDFSSNNLLQIPADSIIYLKQLLKTSTDVDGDMIRPYAVLAYALLRLGQLTDEEFTYLLPLCTTKENLERIISGIENLRRDIGSVNDMIVSRLMSMDNYKTARDYFLAIESVTESVITAVGMNRKSRTYDKSYYPFYKTLHNIVFKGDGDGASQLYEQSTKIKIGKWWRQYLFNTASPKAIKRDGLSALNGNIPLLQAKTENEFRQCFFEMLHLFKAKANLKDYADLNKRYFKTTDSILFVDSTVKFDVLPHCWLYDHADDMLGIAFEASTNLTTDIDLSGIANFLAISERRLHENLKEIYGVTATTSDDVRKVIHNERYERFNALIDKQFDRATVIDLLCKFEQRDDSAIRQAVTNNADIPTIFEYILGIAWYVISDRRGDILSYMNLSLEADLLPRSHAIGGNADIEYKYDATPNYPAHCLLLEATLAVGSNQPRMEMEPVSRHLGEYILRTGDVNAYCAFVSTSLHRNLISDFRNRRTYQYYGDNYENRVDGLKILPLATSEIQTILERGISYDELYSIFEAAYRSGEPVPTWYEQEIVKTTN